jgi:hypothetical protein
MFNVWKIVPGRRAEVWDVCDQRGCISINWLNHVNYSTLQSQPEIRRALIKNNPHEGVGGAPSIWQFTYEVKQGDVVVANEGLSSVVGIGIVASGYLPPDDRRNPNRREKSHRHVRLVDWLIDEPVTVGKQLFIRPTVQRLRPEEYDIIIEAYRTADSGVGKALATLFGADGKAERHGPAEDEGEIEPEYETPDSDLRELAWKQIKKRRGQLQFRNVLRQRYGDRCLVTDCNVVAVLEAAHIDPFRVEAHHHPRNGLLLRADIHTLFDLDLLGIEPKEMRVELHPDVREKYAKHVRKTLACVRECRPSREALGRRYDLFRKRSKTPV